MDSLTSTSLAIKLLNFTASKYHLSAVLFLLTFLYLHVPFVKRLFVYDEYFMLVLAILI